VGAGISGWQLRSSQKGGDGIGKTKVGKGTKVMVVSDGNGLPIGLYLDAAHHHEIKLAEPTLQTIRVPQKRGRPKTRPKELVADKAYDSRDFRRKLRRRGIKPTIPTFARRKDAKPKRGRPIRVPDPEKAEHSRLVSKRKPLPTQAGVQWLPRWKLPAIMLSLQQ
jgi:hypothetical protein